MFSKSQNEPKQKSGAFAEIVGAPAPTIISVDMRVSGDMRTDGDVQIDGVVDGDLDTAIRASISPPGRAPRFTLRAPAR